MIEALLVFGSMGLLLWVLRSIDAAGPSAKHPDLGPLAFKDQATELAPGKKGQKNARRGWHA